jgi:hypothetical protein
MKALIGGRRGHLHRPALQPVTCQNPAKPLSQPLSLGGENEGPRVMAGRSLRVVLLVGAIVGSHAQGSNIDYVSQASRPEGFQLPQTAATRSSGPKGRGIPGAMPDRQPGCRNSGLLHCVTAVVSRYRLSGMTATSALRRENRDAKVRARQNMLNLHQEKSSAGKMPP